MSTTGLAFFLGTASLATAQPTDRSLDTSRLAAVDAEFARFIPSGQPNPNRIDYSVWDEAMRNLVFPMGPSLRQTPGRPDPGMGSRVAYGHNSRYRLEGNRIMFSFFNEEVISSFAEYRADLERTASLVDIASLSRNEQLAFWINLHNVAVIEQIAKAWPLRQPRELKLGGVPMDEAKFITVQGVRMSPRDIRTQIVYPNWRDPKVIYGFWHGDIGGPSIQRAAFTADNVGDLLDRGAREFVNSLRGTQKSGDMLEVSTLFEEARPHFFADWPNDIRAHIDAFANTEVKEILAQTSSATPSIYEADIADLAGGVREPTYSNITTTGRDGIERQASFRVPQGMARLLSEHATKIERIIREGRTGTVTVRNIDLPGQEPVETEVK